MMIMNINIKADIDNLSLSDVFGLMQKHALEKPKESKDCIIEFKEMKFRIVTDINMAINYIITELPNGG